jgi:hypothetical protein
MSTFDDDYKFGIEKENEILETIKTYFNRNIKKMSERYCDFDFFDEKYKYELKSRRNNYNTFDTTLIPVFKSKPKTILLFNFLDGLYYIEYSKTKFEKFEQKKFQRADRPDKKDQEYIYYCIPIEQLKPIQTYEIDF